MGRATSRARSAATGEIWLDRVVTSDRSDRSAASSRDDRPDRRCSLPVEVAAAEELSACGSRPGAAPRLLSAGAPASARGTPGPCPGPGTCPDAVGGSAAAGPAGAGCGVASGATASGPAPAMGTSPVGADGGPAALRAARRRRRGGVGSGCSVTGPACRMQALPSPSSAQALSGAVGAHPHRAVGAEPAPRRRRRTRTAPSAQNPHRAVGAEPARRRRRRTRPWHAPLRNPPGTTEPSEWTAQRPLRPPQRGPR